MPQADIDEANRKVNNTSWEWLQHRISCGRCFAWTLYATDTDAAKPDCQAGSEYLAAFRSAEVVRMLTR